MAAPAKQKYVNELLENELLEGIYLVRSRNLRTARNGSLYLQLELADRTGAIKAMYWNASQALADQIGPDGFVRIKGKTEQYQGNVQLVITSIFPADESEVNPDDFVPRTRFDVEELWGRFQGLVSSLKDQDLVRVMTAFVEDKDLVDKFRQAPAAVSNHHACVGGLLEHTVSVMELADWLGGRYQILDRDMLMVGAAFHDIGKTEELAFGAAFRYTDSGMLVGHLAQGMLILERLAARIGGFPAERLDLIRHMILSHHGSHEFGAPTLPVTAEAIALNLLDNIDAKMEGFRLAVERDQSADAWTASYERMFNQRRIFKGKAAQ